MDGRRVTSRSKRVEGVRYYYAPTLANTLLNRAHALARKTIRRLSPARHNRTKPAFASLAYNFGYIAWVAWHLRRQRCDIVHVHQFSQYVPVIRALNRAVRIVLHMNCEWLSQLDRRTVRRRTRTADLVLGCSDYISQKIQERFPRLNGKVRTVYNGVHHMRFAPIQADSPARPTAAPRLLFVGRVSPEKGIHVLLGAMRLLVRRYPGMHLDIVGGIGSAPRDYIVDLSDDPRVLGLAQFYDRTAGTGTYIGYLKRMCRDGLEGNVAFTGAVAYQTVVDHYHRADILVNPSLSESFGMSVTEAMAAEKPVVATRVGGMVNVVDDGRTGILVDAADERGLADAIARLIEDPELRLRMGKAGRERVVRLFSWQQVSRSLAGEYEQLARNRA
jgi:glycosyltransferase involved in cell wall biosynthesis